MQFSQAPAGSLSTIKLKYMIVLIVLALFALGNYFLQQQYLQYQQQNVLLRQMSQRQQLLVELTSLGARHWVSNPTSSLEIQKQLRGWAEELENAHQVFLQGSSDVLLDLNRFPQVGALFFEGEHSLDHELTRYLQALRAFIQAPEAMRTSQNPELQTLLQLSSSERLPQQLQRLFMLYDQEVKNLLQQTETRSHFMFGGLWVVLFIAGFYVFLPTLQRLTLDMNQLRDAAARQRSILETAVDGVVTIDERGIVETINPAAQQIFGYLPQEVVGKNVNLLMPSPDREKHDDYMRHYLQTGQAKIIGIGREVRGRRKDGSIFSLDLAVSEWKLGSKRMFTGITRDITQRRQAEEALRKEHEFTHAVLNTIGALVVVLDAHGKIVRFNRMCEQITGKSFALMQGQVIWSLLPPEELAEVQATFHKLLSEQSHNEHVNHWIGPKDEKFLIHWSNTVLRDEQQHFVIATGIDITERQKAQQALAEAHEKLEQRVRERTADLQVANEEIKTFSYIVSHDLRSPLVNIKGFAGELRLVFQTLQAIVNEAKPHLSEGQQTQLTAIFEDEIPEALHFIESSVKKMDSLTNAILKLSRMGRRNLNLEWLDMNALVQATLDSLAYQINQAGVQVEVQALPQVKADRTSMEQIITNLVSNAVRYLEEERPGVITISGESLKEATIFHIRDNGRGIALDDQEKVFELFRRVGKPTVPGEGMGLAYVKSMVRRHGGEISCQSTLGEGSTFSFTISHDLNPV